MIDEIRPKADEVASLMAARFGGVRRGHRVDLGEMLKRRGGALPRKLRREAQFMARADLMAGHPKLARQVDFQKFDTAYRALTGYLQPLGRAGRIGGGLLGVAASIVFGLMILGLIALWIVTARGLV
ncbi:hypothetical protein [Paracoccus ravus]|uniref:hypothetical protein n=1 Tax=Paracoccus ravus TaxID=2447760 RepID=UPI00106EF055|nr:hypothetical protein [Paracoccus ravus]